MERARPSDIPALVWVLATKFAVPDRGRAVQRAHAILAAPLFAVEVLLFYPHTYTRTGRPRRIAAIVHRNLRRAPHLLVGILFRMLPVAALLMLLWSHARPLLTVVVVVFVLLPLAPLMTRPSKRTAAPDADWHIAGVASRSLGALVDLKHLVKTIGRPGETIGIVAASTEHRVIYRRHGFRETAEGSLAMIATIPSTSGPNDVAVISGA